MRRAFIFLALAVLAGCGGTTVFHSSNGRQSITCHGAAFWWMPGTTANHDYHACQEVWRKSGYIEGPVTARPAPITTLTPGPS